MDEINIYRVIAVDEDGNSKVMASRSAPEGWYPRESSARNAIKQFRGAMYYRNWVVHWFVQKLIAFERDGQAYLAWQNVESN